MKKQRLPSLVTLLVLTVITVFSWIALDVYRILTTEPDPVVPAQVIQPLDPNLDEASLADMEFRIFYEDSEIISLTPTPTTSPTEVPIGSPSATIEPSPIPTNLP